MSEPLPANPCHAWEESLSLLSADCLPPEDELPLRQHLQSCAACRQRLAEFSSLAGDLRQIRADSGDRVVAAAMTEIAALGPNRARTRNAVAGLLVALAVCVCWLAAQFWFDFRPADPQLAQESEPAERTASAPTWIELNSALAESDEAFDRVLDHTSAPLLSETAAVPAAFTLPRLFEEPMP